MSTHSTVTIAHITDVHLGPIAGFTPRYWNLKRGLGYANWMRKRRFVHRRPVLDRIVADMLAERPDHIAVTGDLANLGLPREHSNALAWLKGVGPPEHVTVVPGNHDTYSRIGRDPGARRWADYMRSNAEGLAYAGGDDAPRFPFVRVIGEVALIGVDSAVETPPFMAWGRIGERQLEGLAAVLKRLSGSGLFRMVLVHHPPLPDQADPARGLKDAAALAAVLAEGGAELVIHGHNHRNMLTWLPVRAGAGPGGAPADRMAVVGAPSASRGRHHHHEALARYNLYRIGRSVDASSTHPWRLEMVGRGLADPDGPVVELERRELPLNLPVIPAGALRAEGASRSEPGPQVG
jgi:3',5'-cyclic AMP phosphodiesterase CpdA